jgi:putative Mn2+ efflux pump MntP
MWILSFALSIDNITYGLASGTGSILKQASEQLVSSVLLAGVGLAVGLAIAQAIPAVWRHATVANGVAGGALVRASRDRQRALPATSRHSSERAGLA